MVVAACAMTDEKPEDAANTWLPVNLLGAEDVRLLYADNVFVNYSADDMTVAFFQSKRPVTGSEPPESLEAVCVARIVLPPRLAEHLRKVLDTIVPQFEEMQRRVFGERKK